MKSLVSSMSIFPRAFISAIVKSLLRGKSLVGLLFAFWSPAPTRPQSPDSLPIHDFLAEAKDLILGPYETRDDLLQLSAGLKAQYRHCLAADEGNMLPSYSHRLPSGRETGRFLAIDMGGTTLRIALVELRGRGAEGGASKVLRANVLKAGSEVKELVGMAFFEWMADRILETVFVDGKREDDREGEALAMALTWSFPIDQTSIKTGLINPMGKAFRAAEGLLGQDLGSVIKAACLSRGLRVDLEAILNDSTACLLSQAYADPSTRLGLILGTGANVAAFLPVPSVLRSKYGDRPAAWFRDARHVVVNTEVSMYGGEGVLRLTRWDEALDAAHARPGFQPIEYLCSGMYLGECCRLPLVEAVERTGIFGGVVPESLLVPYALRTETLSLIESDDSSDLQPSIDAFSALYPSPHTPTQDDMRALRTLASLVARRSSAIIATAVFSFWELRRELAAEHGAGDLGDGEEAAAAGGQRRMTVAFNGAVMEAYPGYLEMCQGYVDSLTEEEGTVDLVEARNSSLLGAAVAVACEGR